MSVSLLQESKLNQKAPVIDCPADVPSEIPTGIARNSSWYRGSADPLSSGFVLPVALVAKCEEKIFLAQKISFGVNKWRKNISSQKIGIFILPILAIYAT